MKKYRFIVAVILLLAGCTTLQEGVTIHTENNTQHTDTSHTAEQTHTAPSTVPGNTDPILSKKYTEAYTYRTSQIDESIQNIPQSIQMNRINNPEEYIRQISEYILNNSKNNFEKVKKAHDLVCLLVKYDADNFWKNTVPAQNWKDTLVTGRAVCAGYAELFKKICDEITIPCEIVNGYARGVGSSVFRTENPTESNHAWNIVTIDNEKYLVDCTWDSGYMEGTTSKQRYNTEWLFLKPEHFIYTHFPENSNHQLLKKAITQAEFMTLPFLKPKYFELVENTVPKIQKINTVEGTLVLEYTLQDGYDIFFTVYNEDTSKKYQQDNFIQFTGDSCKAYLSFPEKGKYTITVFWKKTDETTGQSCGEFGVISEKASTTLYPKSYSSYDKNIQLISPIAMPLERGKKYDFKIKIANKSHAALIYNDTFVQLEKNTDGIFFKEMIIPESVNQVFVGIADSEMGRYTIVLAYSVE